MLPVALSAILFALGARTIRRNQDWRDTFTLAKASLAVSPHSMLMNSLVARELMARGDARQAVPLLEEASRQEPTKARFHVLLGAAYYS